MTKAGAVYYYVGCSPQKSLDPGGAGFLCPAHSDQGLCMVTQTSADYLGMDINIILAELREAREKLDHYLLVLEKLDGDDQPPAMPDEILPPVS